MGENLAQALLGAAEPFPIETNPFLVRIRRGELSREAIRAYALGMTALAESLPPVLASILALCDEPALRAALLGNLLEEEGVVAFDPGQGLTLDPARRHGALARRFARAAGANEQEIAAAHAPPARWFTDTLRAGRWLGPLAFFMVGIEANVPATFHPIVPALVEHYGFAPADLVFFTEHVEADERHGIEGTALLAAAATTPDARRQVVEGARRGGLAWWQFHRQFAR